MNTRRLHSISFTFLAGMIAVAAGCAAPSDETASGEELASEESGSSSSALRTGAAAAAPVLADAVAAPIADDFVGRINVPVEREIARGDGWRQMHMAGKTLSATEGLDEEDVDDDFVLIEKDTAVASAPIPQDIRDEITASLAQETAEEKGGVIIVNTGEAQRAKAAAASAPSASAAGGAVARGLLSCDDYNKTFTKTFTRSYPINYTQADETGSFQGNVKVTGQVNATVSGEFTVRLNRKWVFGCRTVWGKFRQARLFGNATVNGTTLVNGKFEKEWHPSKTVYNPTLFNDIVSVGGVPVKLKLNLPIKAGLDATAKATFKANGSVAGNAAFNITCKSSGCDGDKSGNINFTPTGDPTFELAARAKITPWVSVGLKAEVYWGVANGEVGVKAKVPMDVWAYAGNTCGDANHDGTNEVVRAATVDGRVALDIYAAGGFFGDDDYKKDFNVLDKHLFFKDIIGSTAMEPIFYDSAVAGKTVTMKGSMRSCWPYDINLPNFPGFPGLPGFFSSPMTYQINWGDGTPVETFTTDAAKLFTRTHTYATAGVKVPTLTPVRDSKDHTPGRPTRHAVTL